MHLHAWRNHRLVRALHERQRWRRHGPLRGPAVEQGLPTDPLARSAIPELETLRRTLRAWRNEILAYFKTRLTNARTEGFNNVAKVVKKRELTDI
jgi:transposase